VFPGGHGSVWDGEGEGGGKRKRNNQQLIRMKIYIFPIFTHPTRSCPPMEHKRGGGMGEEKRKDPCSRRKISSPPPPLFTGHDRGKKGKERGERGKKKGIPVPPPPASSLLPRLPLLRECPRLEKKEKKEGGGKEGGRNPFRRVPSLHLLSSRSF